MSISYSQDFEPIDPPPVLSQEALVAGFQQLGLQPGDLIIVHSSLSSLGHVPGGVDTLIEALLSAIGPAGTLMVPYFFDYVTCQKVFDPANPPPSGVGIVTNRLLTWPGALLSVCPSHPVVVIGPDASRLVEGHAFTSPVGIDSPFDRLAQLGGKVLLLGVNQTTNTTIHTGEAHAPAPYWARQRPDRPVWLPALIPGQGLTCLPLSEAPGCSHGFVRIEPFLQDRRVISFGRIGQARCRLMSAQALIDSVVAYLRQDPGGLLCSRAECFFCHWARHFIY